MKKFVIDRSHVVVNTLVVEANNLNEAMDYVRKYTVSQYEQPGGILDKIGSRIEGTPSLKRRRDLEE